MDSSPTPDDLVTVFLLLLAMAVAICWLLRTPKRPVGFIDKDGRVRRLKDEDEEN